MKNLLALLLTIICLYKLQAQDTLYVDSAATGLNDGSTWVNAFTDLQDALDSAAPGDQVWVAKGIYTPTRDTNGIVPAADTLTTFFLKTDSVKIFGGFAGGETRISQRDWRKNKTVLSGKHASGQHSYSVFFSRRTGQFSMLNGFYVQDGISPYGLFSGGITLHSSGMNLANLVIRNNKSNRRSALTLFYHYGSSPTIANVEVYGNSFIHNLSNWDFGPVIGVWDSDATFVNLAVYRNKAHNSVMIEAHDSNLKFHNLTLTGNTRTGGYPGYIGIDGHNGSASFYNSILGDNPRNYTTTTSPPQNFYYSFLRYNSLYGHTAFNPAFGFNGGGNINVWPTFKVDSLDYRLAMCSRGIDEGNDSLLVNMLYDDLDLDDDGIYLEPIPVDLAGNPRISGQSIDMGAYEYQGDPTIPDSTQHFLCGTDTSIFINNETFTDTGFYARTYTTPEGCDSAVHIRIDRQMVDTAVSLLPGDTGLTSAASQAQFQWISCVSGQAIPGATGASFSADSGTYALVVTQNGCTDTSACFTLKNRVSISEYTTGVNASVYPNPSTGLYQLRLQKPQEIEVQVVNLSGQQVFSTKSQRTTEVEIEIADAPAGVYLLKLNTNQGSSVIRLIKN